MVTTLRRRVVVQPGGRIELDVPDLPAGAAVDLILIVENSPSMSRSLAALIGSAQGGFATPEEADAFLDRERDAWDS